MPTLSPTDRAPLRRRITVLAAACLAWAGCMGYRLIDLQFCRAGEMRGLARKQQEQIITLDARRGLLYDRRGRELAMSIEVDSVYANPAEIEDPARTAAALAPALGMDRAAIPPLTAKLSGEKLFVWVRRKVDPEVRAAVEALQLEGIGFAREHKRFYPHGRLAAHVLGWVGMDNKGMDGLELALDGKVRGHDGQVFALRDARRKSFLKVTKREPVPGNSVVLTIDETIQHIAERELSQAIEDTGALSGSAVVMDPASGDILALANEPTFNPNRASDTPDENRKNRAIVDAYEPGSTFKVITMAVALEKGLVRPGEMFDCQNGAIRVAGATIHDHKPFGLLSATEILEKSSNVGVIKIGLRLGESDFYDYIRRFGLGSKTGIELPGEARGLVREPKDWSGVSQATISFGQEISVTPLQLVTAIATVANGGVLQPPRIVLKELSPSGGTIAETAPRPAKRILEQSTVETLRRMMITVVDTGTAKAARVPGYAIAGKTGTAQKIGPDGRYSANHYVASFVGFVPAGKPRLTILVVLDEPRGSMYHGGDIAAPVFKRIAVPALRHLGVPPDQDRLIEEGDDPMLLASAHARRWTKPMPVDEEGRRREQLEEERARRERERRRAARGERDASLEEEPIVPVMRPLPSAATFVAGDEVLLPDLQGHSLRRAVSYLGRMGLRARLMRSSDDPGEDDGVVVAQEPEAGSTLRRGAEVALRPGRFLTQPAAGDAAPLSGSMR
jgi:cell division protein FtsI (penicillin-binding protein 3)